MLRGVKKLEHGAGELRSAAPVRMFAMDMSASPLFALNTVSIDGGAPGARRKRLRGFTLLELMIVISIIMILMAVAVPLYNQSIVQARESVLRSNLSKLRSVISQYTLDKQKAPQSLDELVTAGYLRQIPMDPMTKQTNWEVVQEDLELAVDQEAPASPMFIPPPAPPPATARRKAPGDVRVSPAHPFASVSTFFCTC